MSLYIGLYNSKNNKNIKINRYKKRKAVGLRRREIYKIINNSNKVILDFSDFYDL